MQQKLTIDGQRREKMIGKKENTKTTNNKKIIKNKRITITTVY